MSRPTPTTNMPACLRWPAGVGGCAPPLLSLNRGGAGASAIGPELFDGLGLIRTRELVLSGRYYGLDDLYFTTAVDYGYSKSVDEAFRSWDREAVLEDMVRVIRLNARSRSSVGSTVRGGTDTATTTPRAC